MSLMKEPCKPATFLIVDDDRISVRAMKRAIERLQYANETVVAGDGIEALEHLRAAIEEAGKLPPYVVLLDLNMPRMSGLEFLSVIREDSELSKLVVFVVSTSDARKDIDASYQKNVAGYIVKEDPVESLRAGLEMVGNYAKLVRLP